MPETIGQPPGIVEKVLFAMALGAIALLGVAMAQPVWRGEEMAAEFKSDCDKRGGVLLERKGMFGITYECVSRLD